MATVTTVYHGSALAKVAGLRAAIAAASPSRRTSIEWLYVTETPALAARYANAQASRVVDPTATMVGEHAAVLAITVDRDVAWRRRPSDHSTLDTVEGNVWLDEIQAVELVAFGECEYDNCQTCRLYRSAERQAALDGQWAARRYGEAR